MKKILIIAIGLLFVFAACNEDTEPECANSNSGIYGSWDWLQSTSYFTPNTPEVQNPTTEGYTRTIEINADNTAKFYKNGTLEDSTTFQISNDQISFNSGGTFYYSEDSCILTLDQSFVDGPKEEYTCTCE
ncbi:MAG: hypothetical protein AB8G11_10850 [Saprospiraceae bacterium]